MNATCVEYKDERVIATAKEEGKVYSLLNESKHIVEKVKVDKCLFNDDVKKCDYLINISKAKKIELSIFVELKGSDINKGLLQLAVTHKALKNEVANENVWFRLCIGEKNGVPKSSKNNKLYKELFFASNGNIKIGKNITDKI